MGDPPSLVVSYLKLPPDEQLFLNIRDLFQTMAEKLDHLALVLAAAQDVEPSSEAEKAFEDLQRTAGAHCLKGFEIATLSGLYGKSMVELVDSLPGASGTERFPFTIRGFSGQCDSIIESCNAAIKGIEKLTQEIPITVQRIRDALDAGDKSSASVVFTEANSQVVNELIQIVRDSPSVFYPIKQYFQESGEHFKNRESFLTNTPSLEEIDVMRQRWATFSASMEGVPKDLNRLRSRIAVGPDILRAPGLLDTSKTQSAAAADGSETAPTARKAIQDGSTVNAAPVKGAPVHPRTSWWRSWWQRIRSRITPKHLRKSN
ncbi:hypothetical protein NP233_g12114 [Leucocoprinus birnbaumii]|uniref:Uncharacterized protein n=1 Tax=Leucocoprinus birnbaumii TaxID=56174 RepID=A0AAD5YQB1_9AGAR|nr:hypothetical protein NP233_g12114 [Leucocoprinus birnbaumii]